MHRFCTDANENLTINVHFGRVGVSTTIIKSIRIVNESCKAQFYEARRDPLTNPLDHVFDLEKYTWTLPAGGTFNCRIHYRPVTPSHEDIDYFTITGSDRTHHVVVAQGICIGPNVTSLTPAMLLITCPTGTHGATKQLSFTNRSNVTTNFMFDIDERQCPFKLNVSSGSVKSFGSICVTITFVPPDQGLYAFHLPCLIENQSPIITELYGYCGPLFVGTEDELGHQILSQWSPSRSTGFEGYMDDSDMQNGDDPPITLSSNYLVFDQAVPIAGSTTRRPSQIVSLTNHSRNDTSIHWDADVEGHFDVRPRAVRVRPRRTVLFELHFDSRGDEENVFFMRQLLVRAFSDCNGTVERITDQSVPRTITIPFVTSVRAIGYSFAADSNGYVSSQYEVPETVTLPACVPPLPVYATFVIRKYGRSPMTFRFVPPSTSHFVVKPMLGTISKDFQIVVLGMFPEIEDKLAYAERWVVQFNGDPRNEVSTEFRGYAEYPILSFDDNNLVEFAPVYPGCRQAKGVTIRNATRHCIMYLFVDLPPELNVQTVSGNIRANEILTQDWTFRPSKLGYYCFKVNCRATVLKSGRPIGTSVNIDLRVVGRSELGFLVAMPDVLNFGTQTYNQTRRLSFHVFNFSSVKIPFEMTCRHRAWPIGRIRRDVQIHPTSGTVCPGGSEAIDVCVVTRDLGFYELSIQYFVRLDPLTNDPVLRTELKDICDVNCTCVLSTLKIKDLLYHGTCPSVSKTLLWDVMRVNELNAALEDVLPSERKTINLRFPAVTLREEPFFVKLLVRNSSPLTASWVFKRIQLCCCRRVAQTRGLTFKSTTYSCEHRQACLIYPKTGTLSAYEETVVTIELRYLLLGTTELRWDLGLDNDRHVVLHIIVTALSDFEREPLLPRDPCVSLERIYIGDMDPIYQMYWMQNDTNDDLPYILDTSPLRKINQVYGSEVFSCMTSNGIVRARTSEPVNLKFHPRKFDTFQVTVKLMLGDVSTELTLHGESCDYAKSEVPRGSSFLPACDKFYLPEIPVYFNADRVTLSPISTYSNVTRMITIVNKLEQCAFGYEWKSYVLPGLLEIHVRPRKGTIQAKTLQTFRLTVHTRGYPCKISANVTCEFINVSNRRAYEKRLLTYDALCKELESQFTIMEKDVTVPRPWIEKMKKSTPFYKALAVCCYVYGPRDEQIKSTLAEQLKSAPPDEVRVRKAAIESGVATKLIRASTFILESIMWNILDSKLFNNVVRRNLSDTLDLEYSQFAINSVQRKKLIRRSYVTPPQRYIAAILEQIIFVVIHEDFALETAHLTQPFDVRQLTYQRMYQ